MVDKKRKKESWLGLSGRDDCGERQINQFILPLWCEVQGFSIYHRTFSRNSIEKAIFFPRFGRNYQKAQLDIEINAQIVGVSEVDISWWD